MKDHLQIYKSNERKSLYYADGTQCCAWVKLNNNAVKYVLIFWDQGLSFSHQLTIVDNQQLLRFTLASTPFHFGSFGFKKMNMPDQNQGTRSV